MACQSYHSRLVNTWHLGDQREVYRNSVKWAVETPYIKVSLADAFIYCTAQKNHHTSRISVDSLALFRRGLLHRNRQSVHTNAMHMIVPQVMSEQCISLNARRHAEKKRTSKKKSRSSNSSFPCTLPCDIWILSFTPWWPMKTFFPITKKTWYAWWKRFLTFDCLDITCNVAENLGRHLFKNELTLKRIMLPRGRNQ